MNDKIIIKGAKEHNLKNIDINKLKAELLRLESQKKEHSSTYKMLAKNEKELQKQMQKLTTYVSADKEQNHERKQEKHSL